MSTNNEGDVFTIDEVCRKLRISRPTLDRMAERGQLTKISVGGGIRIPIHEIEKMLKTQI